MLNLLAPFEFPNFPNYFLAQRFQYILKWYNNNPTAHSWMDVEQSLCGEIMLQISCLLAV